MRVFRTKKHGKPGAASMKWAPEWKKRKRQTDYPRTTNRELRELNLPVSHPLWRKKDAN